MHHITPITSFFLHRTDLMAHYLSFLVIINRQWLMGFIQNLSRWGENSKVACYRFEGTTPSGFAPYLPRKLFRTESGSVDKERTSHFIVLDWIAY